MGGGGSGGFGPKVVRWSRGWGGLLSSTSMSAGSHSPMRARQDGSVADIVRCDKDDFPNDGVGPEVNKANVGVDVFGLQRVGARSELQIARGAIRIARSASKIALSPHK